VAISQPQIHSHFLLDVDLGVGSSESDIPEAQLRPNRAGHALSRTTIQEECSEHEVG
jgi:hypothetical protein